jgi:hypothetical protein
MTFVGNVLNSCAGGHLEQERYGDRVRGSRQVLVTLEGLENEEMEGETWKTLEFGLRVKS